MDAVQLQHIWTPAAALAGFQIAAVTWRIKREIEMEARDELTWITVSDCIMVLSFLLVVVGVFLVPIAHSDFEQLAAGMFATAFVLFATTPFVLFGHYNLYPLGNRERPRTWMTKQEMVVLVIAGPVVTASLIWIWT